MKYNPRLNKKWSKDFAYIFGLLLGDGSLPITKSKRMNGKYQIRYHIFFISNSLEFIENVYVPLFQKIFGIFPWIQNIPNKNVYACRIESKEIYIFLKVMGFTTGRKAKIAKIPKGLPNKYKKYLLAGLLDTDGGKKGNGFGFTTASNNLARFCINTFKELAIPYNSCPWNYNDNIYHQIYVNKSKISALKKIPLRNKEKISYINSLMPQ